MASYKIDRGIFKHLDFIIMDLLFLQLSYLMANYIRFTIWHDGHILFNDLYRHQTIILAFGLGLSLIAGNPYKNILKRGYIEEIIRTARHTVNMFLVDIICLYFIHEAGNMSRWLIIYTWGIYFILELTGRIIWKDHLRRKHKGRAGKDAMIILSDAVSVGGLIRDLRLNPLRDFFVSALFLTDYDEVAASPQIAGGRLRDTGGLSCGPDGRLRLLDIPLLGGPEEMMEYANHSWVDRVFLDLRQDKGLSERLTETFRQMGLTTHTVLTRLDAEESGTQYVQTIGGYVVASQTTRFVSGIQVFLKRAMDITGALIGLLITAVTGLFIAPAIKMASPGPVLFVQERIGKNGKPFRMYKFRSMYMDAEERKKELMAKNKIPDGMMFKLDDDPRIIGSEKKDKNGKPRGIGNFIRKTSLDEFPQFYNVLRGDMSLVGTRPPTIDEWEKYSPHHRARMSMRPGITGMWQISGRSNIDNFEKVVELDMQYIQNWTVGMDIRILAKTVLAVLRHDGAE